MKKRTKRFLSLLLLCTIMLMTAGCNNGARSDNNTETNENKVITGNTVDPDVVSFDGGVGRYVEEEYPMPEGIEHIFHMKNLAEGGVQIIGTAENKTLLAYTLEADGSTYTTNEAVAAQAIPEGYIVSSAVSDAAGNIYVSYCEEGTDLGNKGGDADKYMYQKINADGQAETFTLNSDSGVNFCETGTDGSLYGNVMQTDLVHIVEGKIKHTLESGGDWLEVIGDNILRIAGDKVQRIPDFDEEGAEKQNALAKYVKNGETADIVALTAGKSEEELYFAHKTGIYRYAYGANVLERLVDGSLTSLNNIEYQPGQFIQKENGDFLQILYSGTKEILVNLRYDKTMPTSPTTELRVYSLRENNIINKMITAFQKEHPELHVVYQKGVTEGGITNTSDAVKQLNTEIMAGNGPDVIVMNGLPFKSYIEKGILEDLSGTLGSYLQKDEVFRNIVQCYQNEGGLYAAPICFRVPTIVGEKSALKEIENFSDYAEYSKKSASEGKEAGCYLGADYAVGQYTNLFGTEWLKDGGIDKQKLSDFLKDIKVLRDSKWEVMEKQGEQAESAMTRMEELEQDTPEQVNTFDNDIYNFDCGYSGYSIVDGSFQLDMGYISDFVAVSQLYTVADQNPDITFGLVKAWENEFKPGLSIGINALSSAKENAAIFVDYLFQEEPQAKELANGFPVNRAAFRKMMTDPDPELVERFSDDEMFPMEWLNEVQYKEFLSWVEKLDTVSFEDKFILEILEQGSKAFVRGETTLDEYVNSVAQKFELYLAE